MLKRILLIPIAVALCTGGSCTISFDGDDNDNGNGGGNGGGTTPVRIALNNANADILITQAAGGSQANITAVITDDRDRTVILDSGRTVSVNGRELSGPNVGGEYTGIVAAADQFTITVNEPTRGVSDTAVDAPADFDITSPAPGEEASLSGFTLTWSGADASLTVRITITQTIFGTQRRRDFGSFSDGGRLTLDAGDLAEFQQGANLAIRVVKTRTLRAIDGFKTGLLRVQTSQTTTVTPGP